MRYLKRVMALMAPTLALLTGCADSNPLPKTLTLVECRIPKLPTAAQCGTIDVPENRDNPESRKITIAFAVLRASTLKPLPDPLFILAGGPGQAASYLGPFAAKLTDLRKSRDIVLVDQRGTGRSSPLTCAAFAFGSAAINKLDGDQSHKAADCVTELLAQGVDAAQYTTSEWVKDLNEVRLGLGYKKINLWGGSYGTRVALEYARQYPDHIRSAILDGVVPPSMQIGFDVWQTRDIALSNIIDKCKTTRACQARHPDLGAALNTIKANLGVNGKEVFLNDPRTGQSQKHHLNFDHLVSALQQLTYSPELSALIPEIIIRAADGDYGPLYASANQVTADLTKQMNIALFYSVTCSDDVLRMAPSNTTGPTTRTGSNALAQRNLAICEAWPKGKIQNNAAQPLSSRLPTLILSGGLDPATPPSNGTEVARSLPSSRHIVARGYGHIVSAHACGPRLIAAFVDQPDFSTLPSACVDHFEKSIEPALWADNLGRQ